MTDNSTKPRTISIRARLADFVGAIWARVLTILAAVSLVMGILLEGEGLVTGYYGMNRAASEAEVARVNATLALDGRSAEVRRAVAEADIAQVNAKFAFDVRNAEAKKAVADGQTAQVNSLYARITGKYP
ncbi:MAG TPA: hypothetical protein VG889_07195 [Rhizomicrobium sp.]|nr:hypothetical protein [Rhizomicrobium sp.]